MSVKSEDDGQRFGRVLRVNPQKGFAFLNGAAWGYEEDMFIHGAFVNLSLLAPGDLLRCGLHLNPHGKPQAAAPVWKFVGKDLDDETPSFGELTGRLKNLQPSGSAFVDCPTVHKAYKRDAFVPASLVAHTGLQPGDLIAFKVKINAAGHPEVGEPLWMCLSIDQHPEDDGFVDGKGNGEHIAKRPLEPMERPDGLVLGTVKTAGRAKEFIFVECPDSGCKDDVFVHKMTMDPGSVAVGETLAFKLFLNDVGRPQATAPVWKMCGWLAEGEPLSFGQYVGRVERLNAAGHGEVDCPEATEKLGRRPTIFNTLMQSKGISLGDVVVFDVREGAKGHLQVSAPFWKCCTAVSERDVHGGGSGGTCTGTAATADKLGTGATDVADAPITVPRKVPPRTNAGKPYIGKVQNVEPTKGFSFVECPDQSFGTNVFVHKTVLDPALLAKGDTLAFHVKYDEKDRPQAASPIWKMTGWRRDGADPHWCQNFGELVRMGSVGQGWVESPELKKKFGGKDVFVHSKVMESCGLAIGDYLAFDVHVSAAGDPQCSAPVWKRFLSVEPAGVVQASGDLAAAKRPLLQPSLPPAKRAAVRDPPPLPVTGAAPAAPALPKFDEDVFFGAVLSTEGGVVVVDCPDAGHDPTIEVDSSAVDPRDLAPDDAVAFRMCRDGNGMLRARAPLWRLVGWPEDLELLQFGEYFGQIRKLSPGGHGFVDCPEIKELHGHDAAVPADQMRDFDLVVDDLIAFTVQVDPGLGIPWVAAPCWRCCSTAGAESRGLLRRRADAAPTVPAATSAATPSLGSSVRPATAAPQALRPVAASRLLLPTAHGGTRDVAADRPLPLVPGGPRRLAPRRPLGPSGAGGGTGTPPRSPHSSADAPAAAAAAPALPVAALALQQSKHPPPLPPWRAGAATAGGTSPRAASSGAAAAASIGRSGYEPG